MDAGKERQATASNDETQLVDAARRFIAKECLSREDWERKAYVNTMMKEGNHWVNDMGVPDRRDPNKLRRHINKFRSTLRAMKNTITFNDPIIEVFPANGAPADQQELDLATAILRNEFDLAGDENEGMSELIKVAVDEAANKSFAMFSMMPNDDPADNRLVNIAVHDSFDVFFDDRNLRKAQVLVISSFEDRDYLRSRGYENIDKTTVDPDHRSHSVLKSEFERVQGGSPETVENKILIDNVYYVEVEKEGDDPGGADEIGKGRRKIKNFVMSGTRMIREVQEVKGYESLAELFFLLYLEKNKFIKYPNPWMSDAVPLQRSLDDASENIDTILHWVAKVRFLQRMGASNTVQMVGDRHVQKIRFTGEKPSFMEMPNVPSNLFDQVTMREGQIEDIVGMHAASMGRIPADRASGRLTALLQAGDVDNVAEPVRNLQNVLQRIFTEVLDIAAKNIDEAIDIHGDDQQFRAIGEKAFDALTKSKREALKAEGVIVIRPFRNIKVKVVPGNNLSLAQARTEIIEILPLVGEDLPEQKKALFNALMRMYTSGTTRDIARTIEREREDEESKNSDAIIVRAEIEKLARGEIVTATPEQPHQLHMQLKMIALNDVVNEHGKDNPIFDAFMQNIQQHESMLKSAPVSAVEGMVGTV